MTASSTSQQTVRIELGTSDAGPTLLDGGWWPRSTDPIAELPDLVLAIDGIHGEITRLILGDDAWTDRPRRLQVGDRILRVAFFANQPAALLTALDDRGDRVDLLVVPPETASDAAETAMRTAADPANRLHAQQIIQADAAAPSDLVAAA